MHFSATILNTHLIKLDAFLVAMHYLGSDLDADELSCILANLIAEVEVKRGNCGGNFKIVPY